MMSKSVFLATLVAAVFVGICGDAFAQSRGQAADRPSLSERLRSTRRSRPGTGPESQEEVGTIEGTERFVRGNRSAMDFVGADVLDQASFVGQQGAEMNGPVRSSVSELRVRRERNLNEVLRPPRSRELYRPRLRVSFGFRAPTNPEISERIVNQLQVTETLTLPYPIEVSVADGTATLRGMVASARDREMAALLVRFEPGISTVKNELKVRSAAPLPPPPKPLQDQRKSDS